MSSPLTFPIVCFLRAHLDFWMPDFSRHFAGWFGIFPRVYICIQIVVLRVKIRNCKIVSKKSKTQTKKPTFESFSTQRMGQVDLVFTFNVMGDSMGLTFHFYTIGNCRTEIAKIQYHVCLHFFWKRVYNNGHTSPIKNLYFPNCKHCHEVFYSKFTIQWLRIAKTKLLNYRASHVKLQVVFMKK